MSFALWDYQEEGYSKVKQNIRSGYKNNLLISPCGSGKGTLLACMAADAVAKGNRVMILAHRKELVSGKSSLDDRLVSQMGVPREMIGYVMSGRPMRPRPFMLGTIQTAISRNFPIPDVVFIDETHRIQTGSYKKFLKLLYRLNPNVYVFGFTATPKRLDGKPLIAPGLFDAAVQVTTTQELINRRFLVPERIIAPMDSKINLSSVHVRAGDYVQSELRDIYNDEVVSAMIDKWEEYARDRKTMIFTINDMEMAKKIAAYIRARGYTAVAITSDDDTKSRAGKLRAYKQNKIQVCVNVNLFTEGIDDQWTSCVALMMATKSETKYIQAASRGGRPIWNKDRSDWLMRDGEYVKENYLLLDFGQNWVEHGRVSDYGMDGFDLEKVEKKKIKMEAPVKKCPNCYEVCAVSYRQCPACGYEFPASEDKGLLATEVDWEVVDPKFSFFKKFVMMKEKDILNGLMARKAPELLIPIGKVKDYNDAWPVLTAHKLGYYKGLNPKVSKEDYDTIYRRLRQASQRNQLWDIVKMISEKRLNV